MPLETNVKATTNSDDEVLPLTGVRYPIPMAPNNDVKSHLGFAPDYLQSIISEYVTTFYPLVHADPQSKSYQDLDQEVRQRLLAAYDALAHPGLAYPFFVTSEKEAIFFKHNIALLESNLGIVPPLNVAIQPIPSMQCRKLVAFGRSTAVNDDFNYAVNAGQRVHTLLDPQKKLVSQDRLSDALQFASRIKQLARTKHPILQEDMEAFSDLYPLQFNSNADGTYSIANSSVEPFLEAHKFALSFSTISGLNNYVGIMRRAGRLDTLKSEQPNYGALVDFTKALHIGNVIDTHAENEHTENDPSAIIMLDHPDGFKLHHLRALQQICSLPNIADLPGIDHIALDKKGRIHIPRIVLEEIENTMTAIVDNSPTPQEETKNFTAFFESCLSSYAHHGQATSDPKEESSAPSTAGGHAARLTANTSTETPEERARKNFERGFAELDAVLQLLQRVETPDGKLGDARRTSGGAKIIAKDAGQEQAICTALQAYAGGAVSDVKAAQLPPQRREFYVDVSAEARDVICNHLHALQEERAAVIESWESGAPDEARELQSILQQGLKINAAEMKAIPRSGGPEVT